MSLITQCPACSTMFRVVPDQLRISEGWVRCGQCDEVFDANAHLHNLEAVLSTPEPTPPAFSPEPTVQHSQEPLQDVDAVTTMMPIRQHDEPAYDWGPILSETTPADEIGALPQLVQPEPTGTPELMDSSLQADSDADQPDRPNVFSAEGPPDVQESPQAEDEWASTLHAGLAHEVAGQHDLVAQRVDTLAEDPPPSFLGRPPSPPRRWLGTKVLIGTCSLLMLLLLGQVLLQQRDRLAAAAPALRPMLLAACEAFACTVSAPQEIESIAIDSSAFTSVRPGVYLLHVSLKNTAAVALATPALELTLTDTQDQPLLRRVVLPAELTGNASVAAGAEWGANLPISVKAGVTPQKIAGYKLLAFYP